MITPWRISTEPNPTTGFWTRSNAPDGADFASAATIHHLYIAKDTALARLHYQRPIKTFSLDEYISLACDFLERLPPAMVIERLMGELNENYVIAPRWGENKSTILRRIDGELERRGSRQGSRRPANVS
jgi:radical SAM superfamily enzyme